MIRMPDNKEVLDETESTDRPHSGVRVPHPFRLLQATILLTILGIGITTVWIPDQRTKAEETKPEPKLRLLIPAYAYPAEDGLQLWNGLAGAAAKVPVVAIANPASGPGQSRDENYARIVPRVQKAGVRIIGYVATSYAKRPIPDVERDMDAWIKMYPTIEGIFFDEQASGAEHVEYYRTLYEYAGRRLKPDPILVSNPGVLCAPEYLTRSSAATFCLFESSQGFAEFAVPERAGRRFPPRQVAALLYGVKTAKQMRQAAQDAAKKGIGYLFITDDALPNPWDTLPPYWDEEVAAIQELNRPIKSVD